MSKVLIIIPVYNEAENIEKSGGQPYFELSAV